MPSEGKWLDRWREYVRRMKQAADYNFCHPDNECWDDCCDVARELGAEALSELPQLIQESTGE
jgi:hypothetical protein